MEVVGACVACAMCVCVVLFCGVCMCDMKLISGVVVMVVVAWSWAKAEGVAFAA